MELGGWSIYWVGGKFVGLSFYNLIPSAMGGGTAASENHYRLDA
jgi:hypothetical protein